MLMKKMSSKGGTGQACAACKYQRRKCSPECPLAPYFPPDQPKQFLNAHKLFGVSNILRILKQLPNDSQKSDAMKSIVYQANAREKDPVHGCFGIIVMLQTQVERLREELELVRSQALFLEQYYQNRADLYDMNLQPQQQQLQSLGNGGCLPSPWIYPSSYSPYGGYDGVQGQGIYRQCNLKPNNNLLEFEHRQVYSDCKEAYESSAESSMKDHQSLDHSLDPVADHEQLKSAAALFTLTNQYN